MAGALGLVSDGAGVVGAGVVGLGVVGAGVVGLGDGLGDGLGVLLGAGVAGTGVVLDGTGAGVVPEESGDGDRSGGTVTVTVSCAAGDDGGELVVTGTALAGIRPPDGDGGSGSGTEGSGTRSGLPGPASTGTVRAAGPGPVFPVSTALIRPGPLATAIPVTTAQAARIP